MPFETTGRQAQASRYILKAYIIVSLLLIHSIKCCIITVTVGKNKIKKLPFKEAEVMCVKPYVFLQAYRTKAQCHFYEKGLNIMRRDGLIHVLKNVGVAPGIKPVTFRLRGGSDELLERSQHVMLQAHPDRLVLFGMILLAKCCELIERNIINILRSMKASLQVSVQCFHGSFKYC